MNFIVSGTTDIGLTKTTNQDSMSLKVINTKQGRMAFAVLCDGMGGLEKGEVASASVILAFDEWTRTVLPSLCEQPLDEYTIRQQWEGIIEEQNEKIKAYGSRLGVRLGTTVVVLLVTQTKYYLLNVGDSRIYLINDALRRLTNDQTVVAREVELGNLTEEEAKVDPRRSVLLQCVGASEKVFPETSFGDASADAVYMLCSDGFRHEISAEEIYGAFRPEMLVDENSMNRNTRYLIELNKQRRERDNITVALIRTF